MSAAGGDAGGAPSPGAAEPCSESTPEQVAEVVLDAFRTSPKKASAVLWEFASDKLRRTVDDPQHLERLLGNDLFRPLVSAANLYLHSAERIDDSLRGIVTAEGEQGARASYLLAVARSKGGERAGCWLVTGLERVQEV